MVPTNYHGEKMGLGNCREENIEVVVVEENLSTSAVRDEGSEITGREKQHQNANVSVDKKQIGIDVVCNVISMEALIEKIRQSQFQRRPHESTKQCLDKACQGSEYFPEETIH